MCLFRALVSGRLLAFLFMCNWNSYTDRQNKRHHRLEQPIRKQMITSVQHSVFYTTRKTWHHDIISQTLLLFFVVVFLAALYKCFPPIASPNLIVSHQKYDILKITDMLLISWVFYLRPSHKHRHKSFKYREELFSLLCQMALMFPPPAHQIR